MSFPCLDFTDLRRTSKRKAYDSPALAILACEKAIDNGFGFGLAAENSPLQTLFGK